MLFENRAFMPRGGFAGEEGNLGRGEVFHVQCTPRSPLMRSRTQTNLRQPNFGIGSQVILMSLCSS